MKYATSEFAKWLESQGKSPKTARNYVHAINEAYKHISEYDSIMDCNGDYLEWQPLETLPLDQLKFAIRILKQDEVFTELNKRGKGMYMAGLNSLVKYRNS